MTSFGVVLCRIRVFPRLLSKIKWITLKIKKTPSSFIFRNHKKSASFRRRYNNIRRKADEVENVIERRNSMGAKSPNSVRKFNMEVGGSARLIVHILLCYRAVSSSLMIHQ